MDKQDETDEKTSLTCPKRQNSGTPQIAGIPGAATWVSALSAFLGQAALGAIRIALEPTVASDDHRKQHCRKLTTSRGMARNRRANQLAAAKV
jgi:hypothetical protein